jgi:hypothetical protein
MGMIALNASSWMMEEIWKLQQTAIVVTGLDLGK